jgi:hypothetical protein
MKKLLALVLFVSMGVAGIGCDSKSTTGGKGTSGAPTSPSNTPPKAN